MDQGQQERELSKQELVFHTNVEKDPLNDILAFYEILHSLGFRVGFDEAVTKSGELLENLTRILIDREEKNKVDALRDHYFRSPENHLFINTIDGEPGYVGNILLGKYHLYIPQSWIEANSQLIQRALKTAHLRAAERDERLAQKREFTSHEERAMWEREAQIERQKAEDIKEPPLDPEGLRIVIHQKLEEILAQHPELRPKAEK